MSKFIAVTPPQHQLVELALVCGWDWKGYLRGGLPVTMHQGGVMIPADGLGLPETVHRFARYFAALAPVWYVATDKERLPRLEAIAMRQGAVLEMMSLKDLGYEYWSRELLTAIEKERG